ncbi:MAG TPA: penicillin-binding transpeptidase domain-containing protein, partial [Clostridia bacterium]|nr:penicillin-binding transpeptidase domain-containing protein [Clostridia bacterium]
PYPYFIDYVTEKLLAKYSEDMVFKGGLRVFTTLDPKIQSHTEATLANANNLPPSTTVDGIVQPQAAVVVIDHRNGFIRAIAGGREHTHKRQWNRATNTTRPPGSAFKPVTAYGPAVEFLGKGPASVVDDIPKSYPSHPQAYTPKNSDGSYKGLITYREAVRRSVNVAAVEVLSKVGVKDSLDFATKLGISTFHSSDQGLGIALGGLHTGVTPLELAGAYGAFANNGTYMEPIVITKIESKEGEVLENIVPQKRKVMKETTAYLITDMLKSVIQGGTGTSANIGRPAAGKTGTSDDNKDLWFAGYTTDLTCVVWVGYDEPKRIPNAFGGTYAAPIWATVMRQAHVGVPVRDFTQPEGIVVATVDSKSGLKPGPLTPEEHLVTDKFARGTVPSEVDNTHVLVEVCAVSGKLPTPNCRERITKIMVDLPYKVPDKVADFGIRVPSEYCDVHQGPQAPNGEENGNGSEGGGEENNGGNGDWNGGDPGNNGNDNDGSPGNGGGDGSGDTNGDTNGNNGDSQGADGINPDHWWLK